MKPARTAARAATATGAEVASTVGGTGRASRLVIGLRDIGAGVVGALPVLWVLGAVPWRSPALLVEEMFRGFVTCALEAGAVNPVVMVCERAGVPLGMYQLDGALSYPLGGVFVRLGADPLAAWKLSVAVLVIAGFVTMFWLSRSLTGSVLVALLFTTVLGLGSTMAARSWSWYWNVVGVALLPTMFASSYVLFARARVRSVRRLLPAGAAVLTCAVLVGIEWSYAGLFATATAAGAVGVLVLQRGWTLRQRAWLLAGGATGAAAVFGVQRLRLSLAGVEDQVKSSFENAVNNSIDLVALVAPDGAASLLGHGLARLGRDELLVGSLTKGDQLWVAPYLGVATIALLACMFALRGARLEANPRCPPGYLPLLIAVTVTSIVLSVGPVVHVAKRAAPGVSFASPLGTLWSSSPLLWIRYPWTWGFLTYIALLLTFAVLTPALLRRTGSWSPVVWVLAAVVLVEFTSPVVLNAFADPRPAVSTAPSRNRLSSDHPAIAAFEAEQLPELHRTLGEVAGTATVLPWGNTWTIPHLATANGARVRNVGIDRNVRQVERAAPIRRRDLRRPTGESIRKMLSSGWTDAVVLLDYMPNAGSIVRHDHEHVGPRDSHRQRWIRRTARQLLEDGYCVEPHSWFTVATRC